MVFLVFFVSCWIFIFHFLNIPSLDLSLPMVARKPRIVIIGAGMAGLTAANRLVQAASNECFNLVIVEASNRIGGRIFTSEFGGDRVELGATWIHGIGGSPVYKIAERIGSLESEKPWERMDGFPEDPVVKAEGGLTVDSSIVQSVSRLYKTLMDVAQAKALLDSKETQIARDAVKSAPRNGDGNLSIGAFVRQGLKSFWAADQENGPESAYLSNGNAFTANRKLLEDGVFCIHENTERTYTSADSLMDLDFEAEKEYREFPDEQITIAKGYSTVLKSLASVLPPGTIQFGKKVEKIEWTDAGETYSEAPVHLHFEDGSVMDADHVIITVSLGVLKAGTGQGSVKCKPNALFHPPLPPYKVNAISKLGFGVVNKLFLEIDPVDKDVVYPFLNFVFSKFGNPPKGEDMKHKVPWWMRKTVSLCPIYKDSHVLLAWFAGEEALELERLSNEEIINGVSDTLTSFGIRDAAGVPDCKENRDGEVQEAEKINGVFRHVLRSQWGFDPLFRGSYSYVAVGSSGQDIDRLAEPLPKRAATLQQNHCIINIPPPLQLLFAGEATHRTHYSTTHGAHFSGLREANRLLQHYGWTNL